MPEIQPTPSAASDASIVAADRRRQAADARMAQISSLLSALEEAASTPESVTAPAPVALTTSTASTPPEAIPQPAAPAAREFAAPASVEPAILTANASRPPSQDAVAPFPSEGAASSGPQAWNSSPLAAHVAERDAIATGGEVATPASAVAAHANDLAVARLGLASALYAALRLRRPELAAHSLRVALGASAWATYKRLDQETQDVVEVAALLHELAALGAPDAASDAALQRMAEEGRAARSYGAAGADLLACCCTSAGVLDAVRFVGVRFDGAGGSDGLAGDRLPLASRLIAIVDCYDAATARALGGQAATRDQALAELQAQAGKRLDPILVGQFVELLTQSHDALTNNLSSRWFQDLGKRPTDLPWRTAADAAEGRPSDGGVCRSIFEQQLLDGMDDGVVFVDAVRRISLWSKGAERLTGVSAAAAVGRQFAPALLDMCNSMGRRLRDEACPVARCLEAGVPLRQRLEILGRCGSHVAVDVHAMPVSATGGETIGVALMLRDAQGEATLEEKCEALNAAVAKDPMTQVANRAEFDRMQALYMETHQQAGMPFSLIMTDIDHFKRINDTYGHQAGDEAIITMARLLKEACRSGDLVARYGGEEFAVLCADCTAADAAERAEQIRRLLSETPHAYLGNKRLTASFGVTQLQRGDTPELMLGRADRALLQAKEQGRNRVIQTGGGMSDELKPKKRWWTLGRWRADAVAEATLLSEVPVNVATEKLRGFVSDHKAKVISSRNEKVVIDVCSDDFVKQRRTGDRSERFRLEIELHERREERQNGLGFAAGTYAATETQVSVRPKKNRNRRRREQAEMARVVLNVLKSYLMAQELSREPA